MGRAPTPWLAEPGGLEELFLAAFAAKISTGTASPRQDSSFSGSSQGLDAHRLEDNLFGISEQVTEQVNEQVYVEYIFPSIALFDN
jgi:hypothetical protein